MNYNIRTYRAFDKELKRLAKRYRSLKDDIKKALCYYNRRNPQYII